MNRLSKQATWLLTMLSAQTHPDTEFSNWVNNPDRDYTLFQAELENLGLINNGVVTPAGLAYQRKPAATSVDDLIVQIKRILPRNPRFGVIAETLTDSAVMGLIYTLLGEMGARTNPDDAESVSFWQGKINDLQKVLANATPDTLWERRKATDEAFKHDPVEPQAKQKTKKPVKA